MQFLNTSGASAELEKLIRDKTQNLILLSPYIKIGKRIRQELVAADQRGTKIRIIYGKKEISSEQLAWLSNLKNLSLHYCDNLHAKCYLNEKRAIITSMNLYEFSQVNNREMGVLLSRTEDKQAFNDAFEEVKVILKNSVAKPLEPTLREKLTTSKLAKKYKLKSVDILSQFKKRGYLTDDEPPKITEKGQAIGIEQKRGRHGPYFLWPENMNVKT